MRSSSWVPAGFSAPERPRRCCNARPLSAVWPVCVEGCAMASLAIAEAPGEEFRVNNFDLIRLFAALQVASVHVITHFQLIGPAAVNILSAGLRLFPGVPIFFVISGFLISRSYERSASVRDYYRNRCLRIYPALWVCLIVSAGLIAFKMHTPAEIATVSSAEWLRWWAAQMTLFQQYAPGFL